MSPAVGAGADGAGVENHWSTIGARLLAITGGKSIGAIVCHVGIRADPKRCAGAAYRYLGDH